MTDDKEESFLRDKEILSPVIHEHHKRLIRQVEMLIAELRSNGDKGPQMIYSLLNQLEQYYIVHDNLVKKDYCKNSKKQICIREDILALVKELCDEYSNENYNGCLGVLYKLRNLLNNTILFFHYQ